MFGLLLLVCLCYLLFRFPHLSMFLLVTVCCSHLICSCGRLFHILACSISCHAFVATLFTAQSLCLRSLEGVLVHHRPSLAGHPQRVMRVVQSFSDSVKFSKPKQTYIHKHACLGIRVCSCFNEYSFPNKCPCPRGKDTHENKYPHRVVNWRCDDVQTFKTHKNAFECSCTRTYVANALWTDKG